MSIDTTNETYQKAFEDFILNIQPHIAPYEHQLNLKFINSPYLKEIDTELHKTYIRNVQKQIEIYREENVPLLTKLESEAQKYGAITGQMTVEFEGKILTLQQAAKYLKEPDRKLREKIFRLIYHRRMQDAKKLDDLFTDLVELRDRVAKNAGFENYRDYMFAALGRFDYTPEDCYQFHSAIRTQVSPLIDAFYKERKEKLQVDVLKPWDIDVDPQNRKPLIPFRTEEELIEKTIRCFNHLDPFFGECIATMREMGHLDLSSKPGKAPGGFNYPLAETGVPFIFMNAVGTHRDMITMLHEGGHAIHSFLMADLPYDHLKHPPSEVAELASMSMELLTMDYWDEFFEREEDLIRAKKEQIEKVMEVLPWVATIDRFQHWIYLHPQHSVEERHKEWNHIYDDFRSKVVDWTGLESFKEIVWQKQLHLYEVPFYYIEYGMAQLGAIAVWKNYKENPQKAVQQYKEALKLGYGKTISEIYETAGIRFDFSENYIKELADFIQKEYESLKA